MNFQGNGLPLSTFVDQLSDSGLTNLLRRLPSSDLKVLNRYIDDPKIEYAYKETDSRFLNDGVQYNDQEEIEYLYPEEEEIPTNSKQLKRNCPPPSKVRSKRENSDDDREDSAANEEYIKLLEGSFPENFDDNNVILNIGETKPDSHVRVKRD